MCVCVCVCVRVRVPNVSVLLEHKTPVFVFFCARQGRQALDGSSTSGVAIGSA